jgi:hypothetical protein
MTDTAYKTIKAALADGFEQPKYQHYGGERIVVKGRELVRRPQYAISATAWKKRGRRVDDDVEPHARLHHRVGGAKNVTYWVYREDQTTPVKTKTTTPTINWPGELLAGI